MAPFPAIAINYINISLNLIPSNLPAKWVYYIGGQEFRHILCENLVVRVICFDVEFTNDLL